MIRRKPFDEDDSNPDRWLVSYADFITLLFAFFVVMYAISSVNQGKYNQLTYSMGSAFTGDAAVASNQKGTGADGKIKGQPSSIMKPLPLSHLYTEKQKRERESMAKMGLDISTALSSLVNDGKVRVIQNGRGVRIDINDSILFQQGAAELSPAANTIISEIASLLKENQRLIQVEGHTDNTPIHNAAFYSNWELSAVRASSVVRMLSSSGIADKRLSALGFGASQPMSENETAEGRAKNRRVSIMVLYEVPTVDDSSNVIKPGKV